MNISLLVSLFAFLLPAPQIPNYYRSYPTARAEAAKAQKDMLIFFSSSSCDNCSAAWTAFANDANAVSKYISTQVATDNFDGQILYEHFDPGTVPAWVVLDANGKVKERWQGGWKDAYGKGTLYVDEMPLTTTSEKTEPVVNSKAVTTPSPSGNTSSTSNSKINTINSNTASEPDIKTTVKKTTQDEIPIPAAISPVAGYVIQAGYFGSKSNAEKCVAELKTKGFKDFSIQSCEQNSTPYYRVWSSVFATEKEAQVHLQQLTSASIKATVKSTL